MVVHPVSHGWLEVWGNSLGAPLALSTSRNKLGAARAILRVYLSVVRLWTFLRAGVAVWGGHTGVTEASPVDELHNALGNRSALGLVGMCISWVVFPL